MDFNGRYILDEKDNPQPCEDLELWGRWFERSRRQIALDYIGPWMISTVFLALDYSFSSRPEDDPLLYQPMLWESMVFEVKGSDLESLTMRRYRSREAALVGHQELCGLARRARPGQNPFEGDSGEGDCACDLDKDERQAEKKQQN